MERKFGVVLITGISGSGGSYMAEHILEHHPKVEVHGVVRPTTIEKENNGNLVNILDKVYIHPCHLSNKMWLKDVLLQILPEAIFHFSSDANVRESFYNKIYVLENNIVFCGLNFFQAILEICDDENPLWHPVIMHCSTSEVYGTVRQEYIPIKETQPMQASSPYGVSKIAQDMMAEEYFTKYGLNTIRTRMFTYISPRRKNIFATAFAMQVARIEAGLQEELIHGNLDSVRTIVDVRDAMEAYWVAASKCKFGEAYNIGGRKVISVGEFLALLKSKAKCRIPSRVNQELLRPSDVTLQIPDTTKFKTETDWSPKYSFEETVEYLLEHCRQQVAREVQK